MNQKVEESSSVYYNIGTSTYSWTWILAIHHHLMPVNSFTTERMRSLEKGEKRDKYECEYSQIRQCRPNFLAHGCDWFTCHTPPLTHNWKPKNKPAISYLSITPIWQTVVVETIRFAWNGAFLHGFGVSRDVDNARVAYTRQKWPTNAVKTAAFAITAAHAQLDQIFKRPHSIMCTTLWSTLQQISYFLYWCWHDPDFPHGVYTYLNYYPTPSYDGDPCSTCVVHR